MVIRKGGTFMKEFICWMIPTIIVFGFIVLLEGAMIFEKRGEEVSSFEKEKENFLWKF